MRWTVGCRSLDSLRSLGMTVKRRSHGMTADSLRSLRTTERERRLDVTAS